MEPINYILDVKSPIEQALMGYGLGRQDIEQTQVMQEREQMMGLRASQEARAAAQEEERRAAAASERARAEAMQTQMMQLRDMALNGTLTTDAINQVRLANAGTFEELGTAFGAIEESKKQPQIQFTIETLIPSLMGNKDAALSLFDERIAAAQNAGTPEAMAEAQALTAARSIVEADPASYGTAALTRLVATGEITTEQAEMILKTAGQGQGEPPAKVDELKFRAKEAGLAPGTPEYNEFMLRGGEVEKGPLVQNIVGAGETEFAKKAGAEAATQFSTIANQGTTASRSLVELENLETLLSNVETGGTAAIKDYLGSLGIATEGLGDIQAVNAAISRLVPAQRPAGSGTMSDADLLLFKNSLPSLINQPGGNQTIIETIRAINEYDVAASIIAGQGLDGEITQAEARKRLRELPNPLADFKAPKGAAKPAPAPVVIDGVTIQRIE